MNVTIRHKGESVTVPAGNWQAAADDLTARLGPWVPGESCVIENNGAAPALKNSDFGGDLVTDAAARERIEKQHQALEAAGIAVNSDRQLYATGVRMADVGYANQRRRALEHAAGQSIEDAAEALRATIAAEERREIVTTAGALGRGLDVNGAIRFNGLELQEQAIRGLLARLESPALRYVLGLRDRLEDDRREDDEEHQAHEVLDKDALLDVLARECRRFPDVTLKLRARDGLQDVFAVVSPDYGIGDAPLVLPSVVEAFPGDAKATFSYDPTTTAWEIRASVFTPTAVDQQAVGEPFQGYASVGSRDNGTGGLWGGGGIILIRCLNASTYVAEDAISRRIHRKNVVLHLGQLTTAATRAIRVLCEAWGVARADVLALPTAADNGGKLVALEDVVPGFYRHILTARRGELVGVLPGRTEKHVKALALSYDEQRRDPAQITRADLAQGFTRYIQTQPTPVRRNAEAAVAQWVVGRERVEYLAA